MKGEEGSSSSLSTSSGTGDAWVTRGTNSNNPTTEPDIESQFSSPTNKRRSNNNVESDVQAAMKNTTVKLDEPNKSSAQFQSEMENQIYMKVAEKVYVSAKNKAGGIINVYASLDVIRPYFDVELPTVLSRLKDSLIPFLLKNEEQPMDLYGPVMLVFTLIAVLLFAMKDHAFDYTVKGGTLMGTSFGVCFTYWLVGSMVYKFISFLNSYKNITFVEVLSYTGYALSGLYFFLQIPSQNISL